VVDEGEVELRQEEQPPRLVLVQLLGSAEVSQVAVISVDVDLLFCSS
jgi:hypothetical protein